MPSGYFGGYKLFEKMEPGDYYILAFWGSGIHSNEPFKYKFRFGSLEEVTGGPEKLLLKNIHLAN